MLVFVSSIVFSQNNVGKIFFDKSGKVTNETQAYYYRVLEGQDTYKSYYLNGNVSFEGRIIRADKVNELNNLYGGKCQWYYKNGKPKMTKNFNAKGVEEGLSSYYYESGKIWKEITYVNGQIKDNSYIEYDETGIASKIFEEDFGNNNNDWDLYESDKSKASITNGIFELKGNTTEGASRFISLNFNGEDIIIEATIDISLVQPGSKAGIIYGFKDWQNYNYFVITQSSFYVGSVFEGLNVSNAEDMYTGVVSKTGFNNLKILNIGEKSVFSINGEVQFTLDNNRLFGSKVGFAVSGKNTIKIDKLITKEVDVNHTGDQFTDKSDQNVRATGSGIVISKDGYVITNYHVVDEAKGGLMVEITREGVTKNFKATVIRSDKDNDVAILKIDDPDFKPYTKIQYAFKESGSTDVGSIVYTIGFPLALAGMGKEAKFTDGKISAKTGYNNAINSYQTTVPVQPGNSGGPLFDEKGKLVGIVNAKITEADNVSYAIKLNYVKNVIDILSETIELPNDISTSSMSLPEQVKVLSNYVVLIKVK